MINDLEVWRHSFSSLCVGTNLKSVYEVNFISSQSILNIYQTAKEKSA